MEDGEETPIISPTYWDLIVILRYTGRRVEDIAHLIADGSDIDCLKYDLDGDPQLFLTIALQKSKRFGRAISTFKGLQRKKYGGTGNFTQKERVKDLPPTSDKQKYLFREVITFAQEKLR
ncbi:hypothetical protein ACT7DP_15820 [Bacillus paranthracis]